MSINTSTVSDLPTTSVRGALHARAHAPLEVTSTHGNTFSLTRSFKGDTLLNVHHSTPECKQKIEETNDDSFESDCESHAQQSDADDDDQLMTPIHPDLPSDLADPLSRIVQCSVHVDPVFHLSICLDCAIAIPWQKMWGHRRRHHTKAYLPSKNEFNTILHRLNAHTPIHIPNAPVFAIDGMKIIRDLFKCTVPGCASHTLFKSKKRFYIHCVEVHASIPLSRRTHLKTIGQQIGTFKGDLRYFEVDPLSIPSDTDALREVVAFVTERGLHAKQTTYHRPSNQRPRGPLLAQTNWEHCIENVDLKTLRQTVSYPDGEPEFLYLVEVTRQYYKDIAANLGRLSTLTLRALLSTSPSGDLEKAPFRRPQEDPTLEKYGTFVAKFIIFLVRNLHRPIENFDVPLHPQHTAHLTTLHTQLRAAITQRSPAVDLLTISLLHDLIFSLLTYVSPEFLKNEMKDLFTLFLITYHLSDDFGNTNRVSQVPPTISEAQWCFRATAGAEIYMKMDQFNDNSFEYIFIMSMYHTLYLLLFSQDLSSSRTPLSCRRQPNSLYLPPPKDGISVGPILH